MRILWVPHTTFQSGVRTRDEYFVERLAGRHTVHVVCWDVPVRRTARGLVSTLRPWTRLHGRVVLHHLPRLTFGFYGRPPRLTQAIFRSTVRRVVSRYRVDVVICACNWYALGFPPPDLPVPLVVDYFDLLQPRHEEWYLTHGDAVICASSVLYDRARRFSLPSFYVPNGIDSRLFSQADGRAARQEYGLGGSPVVSLIGLTASPRMYFLDAIELVARRIPDVKCLIVGDGELLPDIKAAVLGREDRFRVIGPVPYERIPGLFACTDVGLYPGDKTEHFDAALPIKVLEYSAAGKPVVAPALEELSRLGFPNLVFAEPTGQAFADAICRAFDKPVAPSDLSRFEIDRLADQLEGILGGLVGKGSS